MPRWPGRALDRIVEPDREQLGGGLASNATGEWMYIFKPRVEMTIIYVKVILRSNCVVVSFHIDEGFGHDEDP